jgi:hypothetical protein
LRPSSPAPPSTPSLRNARIECAVDTRMLQSSEDTTTTVHLATPLYSLHPRQRIPYYFISHKLPPPPRTLARTTHQVIIVFRAGQATRQSWPRGRALDDTHQALLTPDSILQHQQITCCDHTILYHTTPQPRAPSSNSATMCCKTESNSLLHYGPIVALVLILTITTSTLWCIQNVSGMGHTLYSLCDGGSVSEMCCAAL